MDSPPEAPLAGTSASSRPRKKVCTEALRASALSAKAERGRVKQVHRQNTLMYYALSRNQSNAMPLDYGATTIPLPSQPLASDGSNEQPAPVIAVPVAEAPVGDNADVVSPASDSDARHERAAEYIVISSSDGGAETATDL
jgi:hypothetical protein